MLDIRRIRTELEVVKAGIARRGQDTAPLDEVAALDRAQRDLAERRDQVRNEITTLSKEVGRLRRDGRADDAVALQERSRELGADEKLLADEADEIGERIRQVLLRIPNLPSCCARTGAFLRTTPSTSGCRTGTSASSSASSTSSAAPRSPARCS
jgi:seryl-tRNA synthetase